MGRVNRRPAPRRRLLWLTISFTLAAAVIGLPAAAKGLAPAGTAAAEAAGYDWNTLKIGGGGFVTGLVVHPTTPDLVYARTDVGGLYRWDEGSTTWTQLLKAGGVPEPTPDDYFVESVAVAPSDDQIVYAAVGSQVLGNPGRILKSTDQGQTWTDNGQRWTIDGNSPHRTGGERLAVDPANADVAYFGSRVEGLWATTDGGGSWQQVPTDQIPVGANEGDAKIGVRWVLFDPSSGTLNGRTRRIWVGVAGAGVYVSEDAGTSWTLSKASTGITMDADIADDGTLYTGFGALWKFSPDSGTWTDVSPPLAGTYILGVDPHNADRVLATESAVRDGHLFRTTDGGRSWDTLDVAISSPEIPWVTATDEENWLSTGNLVFDPHVPDRVWFPQGVGVWRTTDINDAEVTWNFVTKGLEEMVATDLVAPPGGDPVSAVSDRSGFHHTDPDAYPDHTNLTEKFSSGTSLSYSGQHPNFIAEVSTDHRFINPDQSGYSTDGGATWTQFTGSDAVEELRGGNIAVSATDTSRSVWLPTANASPYVTGDRGASWTRIGSFDAVDGLHGLFWWPHKRALTADKVDGGFYVYSTQNGGEFYRSADGVTWEQAPGTAPPSGGNDAHVFGQVHAVPGHAGHVWASVAQGGLYATTDRGDTWTRIEAVTDARSFGFGAPVGGSDHPAVYAHATVDGTAGIWRSVDAGASWELVDEYPDGYYTGYNVVTGDMDVPGRVYVGFTGNGFVYGDPAS